MTTNVNYTRESKYVTIADGATLSDALDCKSQVLWTMYVPSTFEGTVITFKVSADGSTYYDLYDENNALVSMTVAASRAYRLGTDLLGARYYKVVAGTSQTGASIIYFDLF